MSDICGDFDSALRSRMDFTDFTFWTHMGPPRDLGTLLIKDEKVSQNVNLLISRC